LVNEFFLLEFTHCTVTYFSRKLPYRITTLISIAKEQLTRDSLITFTAFYGTILHTLNAPYSAVG